LWPSSGVEWGCSVSPAAEQDITGFNSTAPRRSAIMNELFTILFIVFYMYNIHVAQTLQQEEFLFWGSAIDVAVSDAT
jgi:hypothetical protein